MPSREMQLEQALQNLVDLVEMTPEALNTETDLYVAVTIAKNLLHGVSPPESVEGENR